MNGQDERRTIAAIVDFYADRGAWPSPVSPRGYERALGIWLNSQRVDSARGAMDSFRREVLDRELPGWEVTAEESWLTRAREASDFVLLNGRQPSADGGTGERAIALWLATNQNLDRIHVLREDRADWLDGHCPGWRVPRKPVFPERKGPSLV